jgi:hypothetical protein
MLEDPRETGPPVPSAEAPGRAEWTSAPLALAQPGLPPCELRWERAIEGDAQGAVEIICVAAGGKRLAVKGGDEREMLDTCGSCTIPRETARRPCLFLVPIKTERDGGVRDYFLCRWFYTLRPEQPATKTDWMCVGCPYWFPRPPIHLFKNLELVTRKLIQYHRDVWAGRLKDDRLTFWSAPWSPPVPSWKRFLQGMAGRWWRLWGAP